jgi:hypothetical protein
MASKPGFPTEEKHWNFDTHDSYVPHFSVQERTSLLLTEQ